MALYNVVWQIEIEAGSEMEAAKTARKYQLDPECIATVFYVSNTETNAPLLHCDTDTNEECDITG